MNEEFGQYFFTIPAGSGTAVAYQYTATFPCTVTKFHVDLGIDPNATVDPNAELIWALVYVPEGYDANNITPSATADIYNPTKNVIMWGTLNGAYVQDQKYSRYSRRLSVGDRIALLVRTVGSAVNNITGSYGLSATVVS